MKSALGSGFGAARFTGPEIDAVSMRNCTARIKSRSWIHDRYCRPSAAFPPKPRRTKPRSVSKIPPRSGLMVIAERINTRRVRGTAAAMQARSHASATRILKCHDAGASRSAPPICPVTSSLGASKRCA